MSMFLRRPLLSSLLPTPLSSTRSFSSSFPNERRVSVVGCGQIGLACSNNLLKNGHEVRVYDPSSVNKEEIVSQGGQWVSDVEDVLFDTPTPEGEGSDVLVTALPSPPFVTEVMEKCGLLADLKEGAMWVDHTTTDPKEAIRLHTLAANRGIRSLEAPLTGGHTLLKAGLMTVLCGGDEKVMEEARELCMSSYSATVLRMGEFGTASLVKLITNQLAATHLIAAGEATLMAKQAGVDMDAFFDGVRVSAGNSYVFETETPLFFNQSFDPGFTIDLHCKDLRIARENHSENLPLYKKNNSQASSPEDHAGRDYMSYEEYRDAYPLHALGEDLYLETMKKYGEKVGSSSPARLLQDRVTDNGGKSMHIPDYENWSYTIEKNADDGLAVLHLNRPSPSSSSSPSPLQQFINNKSSPSSSSSVFTLYNSATGEPKNTYHISTSDDVERALSCAEEAQEKWGEMAPAERAKILKKAADLLEQRREEVGKLESGDTGRGVQETVWGDVDSGIDCLNYFAGLCVVEGGGESMELPGSGWGYTRREPLGVTVGIGAWNYPLQSAVWKSAPALAFGNSMVFKPSELTPSTALLLAEVYKEAGVPAGVFNVVLGGGEVGEMMVNDERVAKVSFTGSAATGTKVYEMASRGLKKVTMELGGKSPLIIFDDADIDNSVSGAMMANWYSSGQVCSNGTRVYVHENIIDEFVEKLVERTKKLKLGDPMDPDTQVGPMITRQHREKVQGFIKRAVEEGGKLIYGGETEGIVGEEYKDGAFISPAIFLNCTEEMEVVKEEVFGMVMCVIPFSDEKDVIKRANNTKYGLSGGVFTNDLARGHRVISKLKVGTSWLNNYNLAPVELPWGGYKQSGLGRENGRVAVEGWTQLKSVYVERGDVECSYE